MYLRLLIIILALFSNIAMATPAYVAGSYADASDVTGNATTLSLIRPANKQPAVGDLMLVAISGITPGCSSKKLLIPAPTGWTLLSSKVNCTSIGGDRSVDSYYFYKVATSSDANSTATTYAFPFTTTTPGARPAAVVGTFVAFTGLDTSSGGLAAIKTNNTINTSGGSGKWTTPSSSTALTANTAGDLVVAYNYSNDTGATPTSMTLCATGSTCINPTSLTKLMEKYGNKGNPDYIYQYGGYGLTTSGGTTAYVQSAGRTVNAGSAFMFGDVFIFPQQAGTLNSFSYSTPTSASTCSNASITITAKDSSNNTLTNFTGTVTLSTSTNHGDWAKSSANGTLTQATADSGSATYAFVSADNGTATFTLTNTHADNSLTVSTANTTPSVTSTSSGIAFSDNAFVVSSPTVTVAGFNNSQYTLTFKTKAPSGGSICSTDTKYTGTKTLNFAIGRSASDPGGTAPTISATSIPNYTTYSGNINVSFTNGVGNVTLTTTDVGQYYLYVKDASRTYANGYDILGTSSLDTYRPFSLYITSIASGATSNPGGTATSGSKFVSAGTAFGLTTKALLWQSADDVNSDGIPDAGVDLSNNSVTNSFNSSTSLTAQLSTPTTGTLGAFGGTTTLTSFSSGAKTISDLTYKEAGSIKITASSTDYLGSGTAVQSYQTGEIGRFYPNSFILDNNSATGVCSTMTYMGQNALTINARLKAYATDNTTVLTNYSNSIYNVTAPSLVAMNNLSGTNLSSRLTTPSVSWSSGVWSLATTSATFSRSTAPDGPYNNMIFGIKLNDTDGGGIQTLDMLSSSSGSCTTTCDAKQISSTQQKIRFGQMELKGGQSAPNLPLNIEYLANYWDGTNFVANTLDTCTSISTNNIAVGGYTNTLTGVTVNSVGGLVAGRGLIRLTPQGTNLFGTAEIGISLGSTGTVTSCGSALTSTSGANLSWLKPKTCTNNNYDKDPWSKVFFNNLKNTTNILFIKEL